MDILIPILIMLVVYVIPELLKRRKQPKEYEYPDIPEKVPKPQPAEIKHKQPQIKKPPVLQPLNYDSPNSATSHHKPTVSMPAPVVVPQTIEAVSSWQGKLSPHVVQNGLIFAEILQPPRAYRPIWRSRK